MLFRYRVQSIMFNNYVVLGVMWCVEASDSLVILISSLLIWNSSNVVTSYYSLVGK